MKNQLLIKYHMNQIFYHTVNEAMKWLGLQLEKNSDAGTIATIRKVMKKKHATYYCMNFEAHGSGRPNDIWSNQGEGNWLYSVEDKDSRMLDVKKYGGFSSITVSYFSLVNRKE